MYTCIVAVFFKGNTDNTGSTASFSNKITVGLVHSARG